MKTATDYAARGEKAFAAKNNIEAIEFYTQAILLNPNNAIYFYSRGMAYAQMQNDAEAIKNYDQAIELNPHNAEYFHQRGYAHYELELYEKAIQDESQAIRLHAGEPHYFGIRALAKEELSRYEEAIEDYDQALALNKTLAMYYYFRANLQRELWNFTAAKANYQSAVNSAPQEALYRHQRALLRKKWVGLGYNPVSLSEYDYCEFGSYGHSVMENTKKLVSLRQEAIALNRTAILRYSNRLALLPALDITVLHKELMQAKKSIMILTQQVMALESRLSGSPLDMRALNADVTVAHSKPAGRTKNKDSEMAVLMDAITRKHFRDMQQALTVVKNPNECDDSGYNPLQQAVISGYLSGVRYLLSQPSIEKNPVDEETGNGLLHLAVKHHHTDIVKWLIEKKDYNVNRRNYNDHLPIDLARAADDAQLAAYLEQYHQWGAQLSRWLSHHSSFLGSGLAATGGLITWLFRKRLFMQVQASTLSVNMHPFYAESLPSVSAEREEREKNTTSTDKPLENTAALSTFHQPLSVNSYLGVVIPYVRHYTPLTLPWNKRRAISERESIELIALQNRLTEIEIHLKPASDEKDFSLGHPREDILWAIHRLPSLQRDIHAILKSRHTTGATLFSITTSVERLEAITTEKINTPKKRF